MAKVEISRKPTNVDLASVFDPVQSTLKLVEARMLAQTEGTSQDLAVPLKHLIASGGKRVRVAVTLLMGNVLRSQLTDEAVLANYNSRLITLAAAIEMLHTATLVHDDLIDGALVRRGIPTLNARWSPAATVLTGDFIFARAARLAAETDSVSVMRLFADTLATIVGGEIRQLLGRRISSSRADYLNRIYAKTASLFETATLAPSYLLEQAGRNYKLNDLAVDTLAEITKKFGYHLGMAFQIVDDILDFTGEQAKVGKPVGSDLRQGLFTLPAIIYFENNPNDSDLNSMIDGVPLGDINFDRLLNNIRTQTLGSSGSAIDMALGEAHDFAEMAIHQIEPLPECNEKSSLVDLATYITTRRV